METILQFGGGNFLRAFADFFVHRANQAGQQIGQIAVVQSTESPRAQWINQQQGRYHIWTRGLEDGQKIDRLDEVTSLSRAFIAQTQWDGVLEIAQAETLRFVISNTTEAGLVLDADEPGLNQAAPRSFPAKLLALLHHRWQENLGGLAILPCELYDNNGDKLRRLVLEQAQRWALPAALTNWLQNQCNWYNSLVDRIVSGRPAAHPLLERDQLLTVAEPYAFWAIEAPEGLDFLTDPAVKIVADVAPYALRKVRLLNGIHTALVCKAVPLGCKTVGQALEDPQVRPWLDELVFTELLPPIADRIEDGETFVRQGLERFANPFLEHQLAAIALHHDTKIQTRLVPTYNDYLQQRGTPPPLLSAILQPYL